MNCSIKYCSIRLAYIATLIHEGKRIKCGQHLTKAGAEIAVMHMLRDIKKASSE